MDINFFKNNNEIDEAYFQKHSGGGVIASTTINKISGLSDFLNANGIIEDGQLYKKTLNNKDECPELRNMWGEGDNLFMVTNVGHETLKNNIGSVTVTWIYEEKILTTTTYDKIENDYTGNLKVEYKDLVAESIIKLKETKNKEDKVTIEYSPTSIEVVYSYPKVEETIPITPTLHGAFPSGIDAGFCAILCHTDNNYNPSIETLNNYANQYYQRLHPDNLTDYQYFNQDKKGVYILLKKEETVSSENELSRDWYRLYNENLTPNSLTNDFVSIIDQDTEEEIICYKVYIAGTCQLADLDGEAIVNDQGGTTEVAQFSLPNGYYVLINKKLYLFILDKVDKIDWNGSLIDNEPIGNINIYDRDDEITVANLSQRKNILMPQDDKYYLYIGTQVNNDILNGIEHNDNRKMMEGAMNVRQFVMSSTITEVSQLGTNSNPTNGYIFSDNLEYIGPYTITSSAETSIYIVNTPIKKIANNATNIINTNIKLYLCSEPMSVIEQYPRGFIEIGENTEYIGDKAFDKIGCSALSFLHSDNLSYVGTEAFAMSNECKTLYIREDKLGDGQNDLLYLPDEFYEDGHYIIPTSEISSSKYISNNFNKAYDKKTFGTHMSGYYVYTSE